MEDIQHQLEEVVQIQSQLVEVVAYIRLKEEEHMQQVVAVEGDTKN
jgi:hypothetical protein